jgi:hypothetical protein
MVVEGEKDDISPPASASRRWTSSPGCPPPRRPRIWSPGRATTASSRAEAGATTSVPWCCASSTSTGQRSAARARAALPSVALGLGRLGQRRGPVQVARSRGSGLAGAQRVPARTWAIGVVARPGPAGQWRTGPPQRRMTAPSRPASTTLVRSEKAKEGRRADRLEVGAPRRAHRLGHGRVGRAHSRRARPQPRLAAAALAAPHEKGPPARREGRVQRGLEPAHLSP